MEDNLFASIVDNDILVSKYRLAPPIVTVDTNSAAFIPPDEYHKVQHPADVEEDGEPSMQSQRPILQQNTISVPKYRISIDSVDRVVNEGSMLRTTFIAYRICFTRMSDLQTHAVWKRYKEMAGWFSQVCLS